MAAEYRPVLYERGNMTQVILDPLDPTVGFIGSATDAMGFDIASATLTSIHPARACEPRACVIHRPSDHHMRGWKLNWRDDRGLMERICPHGQGHPDPDDLAFKVSRGRTADGVHACDGCCGGEDDVCRRRPKR